MVKLHNPTKSRIGVGLVGSTVYVDPGKSADFDFNDEQLEAVLKCSNLKLAGNGADTSEEAKAKAEAEAEAKPAEAEEKAKADANKPKR
jgi:hypothetical protein